MDMREPAERADRTARHSTVLQWAVRGGLFGYGLVHLLVAWVAVRLVLTAKHGSATGRGALAQLADGGWGRLTLGALALGFGALALWQLVAALVGYRDREGLGRLLMRVGAAGRVVAYGYLAVAAAGLAFGGRSARGHSPRRTTAEVLALPAGAWLLALVGVGVVITGIALAVFGWRKGFLDQLDEQARTQDRRVPIVVLGRVGYLAKGVAFVVIGVLIVRAGWTTDPQKTGGLDESLRKLLGAGWGPWAIVAVGAGIACFGLYLIARARHLNLRMLTS